MDKCTQEAKYFKHKHVLWNIVKSYLLPESLIYKKLNFHFNCEIISTKIYVTIKILLTIIMLELRLNKNHSAIKFKKKCFVQCWSLSLHSHCTDQSTTSTFISLFQFSSWSQWVSQEIVTPLFQTLVTVPLLFSIGSACLF